MMPVPPAALSAPCDPSSLPFTTTAELTAPPEIVGQAQAVRAIELGLALRAAGYHLFVVGEPQTGRHSMVRRLIAARAAREPTPPDLCYAHNFEDPDRPHALELPAGRSRVIRGELERLVNDYARRLPVAFESEVFARRAAAIAERAGRARAQLIAEVEARLAPAGFRLDPTGGGLDLVVVGADGDALDEAAFAALPAARRVELDERGRALRGELEPQAARLRELERAAERDRDQLAAETARAIARAVSEEAVARIGELDPALARQLAAIEADLASECASFLALDAAADDDDDDESPAVGRARRRAEREALVARYVLHVVVDRTGEAGAPVIDEPNPSYVNLFGRIDRKASFGVLETSVAGLKAGALHRARGGYLVVDAAALLDDVDTWAALKRALRRREVRIEEALDAQLAAGSLHPAPSPLDATVVLLGTPALYQSLFEADDALADLFKIKAELDDTLERTPATERAVAAYVAASARELAAPALRADAVAALIEQAAREAGHQHRVSARLGRLRDLVVEAAHHGRAAGRGEVIGEDVARAIAARGERQGLLERTLARLADDGTLVVRTAGAEVGAANGLSVITDGEHAFGHVQRITARARAGRRGIIDIEREVGLAGDSHAKGVLILAGFLAGRFVRDRTLALHASIAIEQSHGMVEGDSASLVELCALLSAIGELPLRQDLAVTGAVSQLGEVLPVGGVTLKVEGFFELCRRRGLTGTQGVLVPRGNLPHLMLRREVVDAARAGRFSVYAVDHVDAALGLLTGRTVAPRAPDGRFPHDTAYADLEATLARWAPAGDHAVP